VIIPVNPNIDPKSLFFKHDKTYASKGFKGLNIAGKAKFMSILWTRTRKMYSFNIKAISAKECYIGPFWGEFGNFLLHYLPYISYLHRHGVKLNLCCLENYQPLLIDDKGNPLYKDCVALRDFFAEVRPSGNNVTPPADVQQQYLKFKEAAEASGKLFLDISDRDLYWYILRNWQLRGRQHPYHLEEVFKKGESKENNVVLFPRKKSGGYTHNNGEPWDYMQLARALSPYVDNVIITGHPSMSSDVQEEGNIKVRLSTDNRIILENSANAKLIVTQHSGAMHLGSYLNVPVMLIFKGQLPIKGLDDSVRFIQNLQRKDIYISLSEDDLVSYVSKNLKKQA
jgi:hypothetical protein